MKNIFNKAVQYSENIYYGAMFPTMSGQRKLGVNLITGISAVVGFYGLLSADAWAVAISSTNLACAALAFGDAGSRIHKNADLLRPEF